MTTATTTAPAAIRHYLQFSDFTADEYAYLFDRMAIIKKKFKTYEKHQPLVDRTLAMIFEKASTRTRVSFEAGMYQLGGSVVHLTTGDSQLGRAEPIEDSAKVISRMVDLVMIRTYEQTKIEGFTPEQRVFLGWAQVWCESARPEAERLKAATNPHSSNKYRVNGPTSNMPEFQKAFSCKANRSEERRVGKECA